MQVSIGQKFINTYTGEVVKVAEMAESNSQGWKIILENKKGIKEDIHGIWFAMKYEPNSWGPRIITKIKDSKYIRDFTWREGIILLMQVSIAAMWSGFFYVVGKTILIMFIN